MTTQLDTIQTTVAGNDPACARETILRTTTLEDRYRAREGLLFLTGTQVLVRLPLMQRQRDLAAGLNTAGYISGYRGSPVGGYDQALVKAAEHLGEHQIRFQPGLNEDLAATALWGTQQLHLHGDATVDGVFGIWYGKGPGVDRSGDVFRHANQAGTAPHGGVLAIAGDDHGAKSSTVAAQVDHVFIAVSMPIFAPATVQDYLDYGLHGFALSRFAGVWVAIKAVTDTIESAGIVDVSPGRLQLRLPENVQMPPGGVHGRWPEEPFPKLEERLVRYKIPAVLAYARANRLNRNVFGVRDCADGGAPARLAIVATGKAWLDCMQALSELGISAELAQDIRLKVCKVAMPWPLEPTSMEAFVEGAGEVLVFEEKRALVESQLKEQWYRRSAAPAILGKRDDAGNDLVPEAGELSPALCAEVIAARLLAVLDAGDEHAVRALEGIGAYRKRSSMLAGTFGRQAETLQRIPYFCAGCPHNTSTRVPEGSRAHAGIGCHYMAMWMDRSTSTFSQMGGEGMTWVGQAPFSTTPHVFQNLGDGTFFHSGSLAIRHALASRTPITFKILFNDAVAMTGGQRHDGQLSPRMIAALVRAEGVERIEVVGDEPEKYPPDSFPAGVGIHHRRSLDAVQESLRSYPGVSVLIYDQTCAAEKRRRRKRGAFPDPERRVFINAAVCEGCGDCGVQANCVAIEPLETPLGRKRRIQQSACNKDFSCIEGFCPSFVTVEGGRLRRGRGAAAKDTVVNIALPVPQLPGLDRPYAILVTGIGGTGVVTIGQILGMAAYLEGKAVTTLDMAGLAQKNGAVMSFVRIGKQIHDLYAPRIGTGGADTVLGCDLVTTASREALAKLHPLTRAIVNLAATPTADFTRNTEWSFPLGAMESAIVEVVGRERASFIDASGIASGLLGDAIAANLFLLGFAWQNGALPLGLAAIERAIQLNETAVEQNLQAFLWGRRAAVDRGAVMALLSRGAASAEGFAAAGHRGDASAAGSATAASLQLPPTSFTALMMHRRDLLRAYQNDALAARWETLVRRALTLEHALRASAGLSAPLPEDAADAADTLPLASAVARYFAKLLAYKDEYEVARLHHSPTFAQALREQFEGAYAVHFHLAPPLIARRNAQGHLVKARYGPWMMSAFGMLKRLKFLRGTPFDPFGYSAERRAERTWIARYADTIGALLDRMATHREVLAGAGRLSEAYQLLIVLARLPEGIRGFGHVKERHLHDTGQRWSDTLAAIERLMHEAHTGQAPPTARHEQQVIVLQRKADIAR